MLSLTDKMRQIIRCAKLYRDDKLDELHLSVHFFDCICTVSQNPGISQDTLARMLYLNKSNITRKLAVLEQEGYVERRQSEQDKRVTLVYPTEKASEVVPVIHRVTDMWNVRLTEGITEQEIQTFEKVLNKLLGSAEEIVN